MKNSSNILLGILGAAAAGVVIGMIIAPEKGKDLRSNIKSSAGDFKRKLGDLLSKGREKYDEIESMIDDENRKVRKSAKDFANEASSTYKDFSDKAEETYNDLSSEATRAYKKAKS